MPHVPCEFTYLVCFTLTDTQIPTRHGGHIIIAKQQ